MQFNYHALAVGHLQNDSYKTWRLNDIVVARKLY